MRRACVWDNQLMYIKLKKLTEYNDAQPRKYERNIQRKEKEIKKRARME